MSIMREDLEAGRVDLSDVAAEGMIGPVHPGELLKEDVLEPLGLDTRQFAEDINIPFSYAEGIIQGRQAITVETALRLERYLGTTAEFWLGFQAQYDLETAEQAKQKQIKVEIVPMAA